MVKVKRQTPYTGKPSPRAPTVSEGQVAELGCQLSYSGNKDFIDGHPAQLDAYIEDDKLEHGPGDRTGPGPGKLFTLNIVRVC